MRHRARPAHHYPRRYVDRTGRPASATSSPARRRWCWSPSSACQPRRRPRTAGDGRSVEVTDGTGTARGSRSSTSPGASASCRPGTEAVLFGKVDVFRGRPPDDQPGRRPDRRPDRPHRPDLPAVREGRRHDAGRSPAGGRGRWRAGRAASPTRCPSRRARALGLVDRTTAVRGIHLPESDGATAQTARRRLVFDELLRVQLALVLRKRALERTAKGIRHDGSGGDAGAPLPRAAAVPAHRRPAAAHRRDRRRPGRPPPDAPAAPGRRRRGQDAGGRERRCWSPSRAVTRARSWRPPRCWPSSTPPGCGRCSTA